MKKFISLVVILIIMAFVTNCGRQTAEQLFALAENLEKEEKFDEALAKYEKILVEYPETKLAPDVYFKIAQIAGNLKKFHKCVDAYERIIELNPDHEMAPKAQFMMGYIYANELKDSTKAKAAYTAFLDKYSEVDSGMTASAQFELKYMGKDINEIEFLQGLASEPPEGSTPQPPATTTPAKEAKGN